MVFSKCFGAKDRGDGPRVAAARLDHYPALDGLRGVAILLVLLQHGPSGWKLTMAWPGFAGVDLFFALSGFLITRIVLRARAERAGLLPFFKRRARRIVPPLALTILGVWLLAPGPWVWWAAMQAMNLGYSLGHVTHDQPLIHCWSLGVEEHFYALWPFVVYFASERRVKAWALWACVAAVAIALWCQFRFEPGEATRWVYTFTPIRSLTLVGGAMLAYHEADLHARPGRVLAWIAGLGGLLAGLAWLAGAAGVAFTVAWSAPVCVAAVAVTIAAPAHFAPLADALSVAWLRAVGRVSYGLYLYHWPIFWLVNNADVPFSPARRAALAMTLTAAAVLASWRFVERPGAPLMAVFTRRGPAHGRHEAAARRSETAGRFS